MNRMEGEICYGRLVARVISRVMSRDGRREEDARSWAYRVGSTDIFCATYVNKLGVERFAICRWRRCTLNEDTGVL